MEGTRCSQAIFVSIGRLWLVTLAAAIVIPKLGFCYASLGAATHSVSTGPFSTGDQGNGRPLQLLYPDENHVKLLVDEKNLRRLAEIPGPIAVVTAVGPIHSGKSFLLNQLLGRTHGFEVGYSVRPGTMGLQMWSEPIRIMSNGGNEPEVSVLLMDTEGFGGPNVTRTYDNSLYAIAALCSSELLFTTMKMIDSLALEELEEMTRDANLFSLRAHSYLVAEQLSTEPENGRDPEHIEANSGKSSSDGSPPHREYVGAMGVQSLTATRLNWVVQDFVQDLESLTPLQWLDSLIDATRRSTDISAVERWTAQNKDEKQKKSVFAHSLRDIYPSIDCVTLRAPAEVDQMQRLDRLSIGDLNFEYREQLDSWRRRLFQRAAQFPRMRSREGGVGAGKPSSGVQYLSGADLADMLRFFASAANNNFLGNLQSFIQEFRKVRAELAKNDLLMLFQSELQFITNRLPPPFLPDTKVQFEQAQRHTLKQWNLQVVGEGNWAQEIRDRLEGRLWEIRGEFITKAEEKIRAFCHRRCETQETELQGEIAAFRGALPVMPEQLEAWIVSGSRKHKTKLESYENVDKKYVVMSEVCLDEVKRFDVTVAELYRRFRLENTNAIVNRVEEGIQLAVSTFVHALQDGRNALEFQLPLDDFRNSLFVWKASAVEAFDKHVGQLRNASPVKETCGNDLQHSLKEVEDSGLLRWDQQCEEAAMDIVNHWAATLSVEVLAEFRHGLPVDEDSLSAQFSIKDTEAHHALEAVYCARSPAWNRAGVSMAAKLSAIRTDLEAQNVIAIKVNCKEPLDILRDKLKDVALGYYFWSSFCNVAREMALELLQSQQAQNKTSVKLSEKLVKKVTENWLSTDVHATYAKTIDGNRSFLYWSIFGAVSVVGGLLTAAAISVIFGVAMALLGGMMSFGCMNVLYWMKDAFGLVVSKLTEGMALWLGRGVTYTVFAVLFTACGGILMYWFTKWETKLALTKSGAAVSQPNGTTAERLSHSKMDSSPVRPPNGGMAQPSPGQGPFNTPLPEYANLNTHPHMNVTFVGRPSNRQSQMEDLNAAQHASSCCHSWYTTPR